MHPIGRCRSAAYVLPKFGGQAGAYILKNWLARTRYLEHGDLPIDNNRAERSLHGIAVGRNNWTFLGGALVQTVYTQS
jgi:hypothetical protein